MLQMAGALGPFVKEFMDAQDERKREREGRLRRAAVRGRGSEKNGLSFLVH